MAVVKCQGCAWLGVRLRHTRALVDADEGYRYGSYVPTTNPSGRQAESICDTLPVCFANKRKFYDELRSPCPDLIDVRKVIEKPYECDQFTEWQPGFTPRDLLDMKILEDQRAALKQEANEQRQHRDDEARRNQQWRILELAVMGGIVTLASVIAQIGSAFIERGTLFPDKRNQQVAPAQPPPKLSEISD